MFAAAATPQSSAKAMPPPIVTCSITARLSRQSVEELDELDPLTNLEEPTVPPAESVSARKKLPVTASSSHLH